MDSGRNRSRQTGMARAGKQFRAASIGLSTRTPARATVGSLTPFQFSQSLSGVELAFPA